MRSLSLLFIPVFAFVCVLADSDRELRKSIEVAMKCQYREPPKGPVIAVTPSRFTQIVVVLHERFGTPACFKTFQSPVNVSDEKTWPFCVFGRCSRGRCQCAEHFGGPKCSVHMNNCWLLYCYLTSCHPNHQSLHCLCDPSLYGTRITSGIYWYNEGKSSKYVPPPTGWQDQPTGVINLEGDSNFAMGASNRPNSNPAHATNDSPKQSNHPEKGGKQVSSFRVPNSQSVRRKNPIPQKPRVPGFDSAGRMHKAFGSKEKENQIGSKEKENQIGTAEEIKKVKEKSDVEEALEELEEVSLAVELTPHRRRTLVLVLFCIYWMHRTIRT